MGRSISGVQHAGEHGTKAEADRTYGYVSLFFVLSCRFIVQVRSQYTRSSKFTTGFLRKIYVAPALFRDFHALGLLLMFQ